MEDQCSVGLMCSVVCVKGLEFTYQRGISLVCGAAMNTRAQSISFVERTVTALLPSLHTRQNIHTL